MAWPCYRLIFERRVTWADLECMTMADVEDLNVIADELARIEALPGRGR